MRIRSQASSTPGRVRPRNEDAFGCFPELGLYVVADGIGSGRSGEVASKLAIGSLYESLAAATTDRGSGDPRSALDAARGKLAVACSAANELLRRRAASGDELDRTMGTTIAAVQIHVALARAVVAHAGDSRVYRMRGNAINRLTDDHTLASQLVRDGRLSTDDAAHLRHGEMLTRAMGLDDELLPDLQEVDLRPGDLLLLCTDGVHDMLSDDEICAAVSSACSDLPTACGCLLDLAAERGGRDDATVVLTAVDP